jgi:hypothetical protein
LFSVKHETVLRASLVLPNHGTGMAIGHSDCCSGSTNASFMLDGIQ